MADVPKIVEGAWMVRVADVVDGLWQRCDLCEHLDRNDDCCHKNPPVVLSLIEDGNPISVWPDILDIHSACGSFECAEPMYILLVQAEAFCLKCKTDQLHVGAPLTHPIWNKAIAVTDRQVSWVQPALDWIQEQKGKKRKK